MEIIFTDSQYITHRIEPFTKYKDRDGREFLIIDLFDDVITGYVWLMNIATEEKNEIHLETFKRYLGKQMLVRVPPVPVTTELKAA